MSDDVSQEDRETLGRALMRDHGCIHHQGPNPFLNPCRACMRRVALIVDLGWRPPVPECGALPPDVEGAIPCHLDQGHDAREDHFSSSGCAGGEIRWSTIREGHPCGHETVERGCGGCDPGAIEYVIEDGVRRPFDPERDMAPPPRERRRARYWWMRLGYTVQFLHAWGERATPNALHFVWEYAGRDYDRALAQAFEAGDIDRGRYFKAVR